MKKDKKTGLPMDCRHCKHLNEDMPGTCKAFPYGIPTAILSGELTHDKEVKGQEKGYTWQVSDKFTGK